MSKQSDTVPVPGHSQQGRSETASYEEYCAALGLDPQALRGASVVRAVRDRLVRMDQRLTEK